MRKRKGPITKNSGGNYRFSALPRGVVLLVLLMGLLLTWSPVFAFPETTSYRTDETDAFPPTYIVEQQGANENQILGAESIFFRPPAYDPASTLHGRLSIVGDYLVAARFQIQPVRQRIREAVKFLKLDIDGSIFVPDNSFVATAVPASNSGPIARSKSRTVSSAVNILIQSDFTEFILNIVQPSLEPGGIIGITIRSLGQFVLMYSGDTESFVFVDIDKTESFRMLEGGKLSSGANPEISELLLAHRTPGANNYGPTNSLRSFLLKLQRLAMATLTHPVFIAFILFGIGLLVLRKLSRQGS